MDLGLAPESALPESPGLTPGEPGLETAGEGESSGAGTGRELIRPDLPFIWLG